MNNQEVAHLWANQSRERAKGSSFYFEGDTIYSYGSHFPIARHYKGVILFTTKDYSRTTARHKSETLSACSHKTVFQVVNPASDPSGADVKNYAGQIADLSTKAARARTSDFVLKMLQSEVDEANSFCERFGFKTRFTMPDNIDELKAKARASAERERKQKAAADAKFEREAQEVIAQWKSGELTGSLSHRIEKVYLRALAVLDDSLPLGGSMNMETSKGARVALSEAERAFRFCIIARARGWHRNGDQFKVGDYQLDAVNEQGVVAGCHRIGWDEIERFAKTQGWL